MHGPEECAGNVQQLCVKKYASFTDWWEFVQCQNYQGREKVGGPDVALKCARTAGQLIITILCLSLTRHTKALIGRRVELEYVRV